MTALMILMHRRLPAGERYPLPPREITMKLAKEAGVHHEMSPAARYLTTLLAHFGYGAATGGLYATAAAPSLRSWPGIIKGAVFGSLVWSVSYFGIMPALHVLRPADQHPARRNALMFVAHLLWGTVLALFAELLRGEVADNREPPLAGQAAPHRDAI